jgi:hypothetical protein
MGHDDQDEQISFPEMIGPWNWWDFGWRSGALCFDERPTWNASEMSCSPSIFYEDCIPGLYVVKANGEMFHMNELVDRPIVDIIKRFDSKFVSGNDIPVRSIRVSRAEWDEIRSVLYGCLNYGPNKEALNGD